MMKKGKIIAIIGPSGSGKTTLGKLLSKKLNCHFFEEPWKGNFYLTKENPKDPLKIAIAFLLLRFKQHQEADKLVREGKTVIMDTFLDMTRIYSIAFLNQRDYEVFNEIFQKFSEGIQPVDIIIHLFAHPKFLFERIKKRGYNIEATIGSIRKSDNIIRNYLKGLKGTKILRMDVSKNNFFNKKASKRIKNFLQ